MLHARQRTGRAASGRGAERFVNELAGRVRRVGASGPPALRADSGFWSAKVLTACRRHDLRFSITVRQTKTVGAAIAAISEDAWQAIDYPDGGVAQVAETTLGPDRLVVRRTRLTGPQATLWPDWRPHAFVTDRAGSAVDLDADHRRHAVCELAIRDLKDGAGLRHCPSVSQPCNARTAGRPRGRLLQPPTDTPTRAAGALHGPRRTASTHAAASPLTKERPKAVRPRASTRPAVDPGLAHCCRGGPWSSGGVPFCRACSACWSSRDDDAAAAVEAVRRRLQEERGHIGA